MNMRCNGLNHDVTMRINRKVTDYRGPGLNIHSWSHLRILPCFSLVALNRSASDVSKKICFSLPASDVHTEEGMTWANM